MRFAVGIKHFVKLKLTSYNFFLAVKFKMLLNAVRTMLTDTWQFPDSKLQAARVRDNVSG